MTFFRRERERDRDRERERDFIIIPSFSNLSIYKKSETTTRIHYSSHACISTFPELVTSQSNLSCSKNRNHALACTSDKFREIVEMALIIIFEVTLTLNN